MEKSRFSKLFDDMANFWDIGYSKEKLFNKSSQLYESFKYLKDDILEKAFKSLTAVESEEINNPFKGNLYYNFKMALRKNGFEEKIRETNYCGLCENGYIYAKNKNNGNEYCFTCRCNPKHNIPMWTEEKEKYYSLEENVDVVLNRDDLTFLYKNGLRNMAKAVAEKYNITKENPVGLTKDKVPF